MDIYFSHLIKKYKLIEILTSTDFKPKAMKQVKNVCYEIERNEPIIRFIEEMINSFDIIFDFHMWYKNGRDKEELEALIKEVVVERIRYPYDFK